jgi:hypothetical protein
MTLTSYFFLFPSAVWVLFYLVVGQKVILLMASISVLLVPDVVYSQTDLHASICVCNAGKRYSLPNSRIMIHQPLGGAQGQETDLEIQVNFRSETMSVLILYQYNI